MLAAVVVVVINPADMLKRARDGRRMTELAGINRALGYYQTLVGDTGMGSASVVYISLPDTDNTGPRDCDEYTLPAIPSDWSYYCAYQNEYRRPDGTGWVPVNFSSMPTGSPFAAIPIDPQNNTSYYYTYITGSSWVLRALLESQKLTEQAANDGGVADAAFEKGTNLSLGAGIFPGGSWGYGSTAGAFALYVAWGTADQNSDVGFRCAR